MIILPVIHHVPLEYILGAAETYHVDPLAIISVLETERGRLGQVVMNKNATYDIGPMQINSSMLPDLKKHHITQEDIQYNAKANIYVGAWILAKKIAHGDGLFAGIGDYNSHTKKLNECYYTKVRINYTKLKILLS